MSGLEFGSDIQIGLTLVLVAAIAAIAYLFAGRRSPPLPPRQFYRYHEPHTIAHNPVTPLRDFGQKPCPTSPHNVGQQPRASSPHDVGEQLHAVMQGAFQKRRLMNPAEYRVFKIIEDDLMAAKTGHRVFAQTSLGEVLQSTDTDAFYSINAKRVDILIVNQNEILARIAADSSGGLRVQVACRNLAQQRCCRHELHERPPARTAVAHGRLL